jgi:fatty-acyl-CoA synthase
MDPTPSLGELLRSRAAEDPDTVLLAFAEETVTYGETAERAAAVAAGLVALGVAPGERVGILMTNSVEYAVCLFGTWLVGAVAVPVNARYVRQELAYLVMHSRIRVLFAGAAQAPTDFLGLACDALPGLAGAPDPLRLRLPDAPALTAVVLTGSVDRPPALSLDELVALGTGPLPASDGNRTALVLYTSGTTARPKGCEIRGGALVRNWTAWGELIGFAPGEKVWAPCPMFHISGIGPILGALIARGTMLTDTHFEAGAALRLLARYRPEHLFPAFPPITLGVLHHPDYRRDDWDFVRTLHNVAAPEVQRAIQRAAPAGAVVTSNFGMTEGAGPMTYTRLDDDEERRLSTTGTAFPGYEVRVVDPETGRITGPGERGEIQFRAASAFHAYLDDPVATAATIVDGGWVRTGDLGALDSGGRLSYLGRIKDMLKVGGENVAPLEIEAHLGTHPAVHLAQVIGRPDERLGEVPVAFVELRPGAAATPDELIAHCVGQLARFKVPRAVYFVTEWPTSTTKIVKSALRIPAEAGHDA